MTRPLRSPTQRLDDVLAATCYVLGVTDDDLRSGRRMNLSTAREVFVLVARRKLGAKYQAIAATLGRRDHGIALMAYRRAMERLDRATDWGLTYAQLAAEIVSELGEK